MFSVLCQPWSQLQRWLPIVWMVCWLPVSAAASQPIAVNQTPLPRSNDFSLSRIVLQLAQDPCQHTLQQQEELLQRARAIAPAYWRPHAMLAILAIKQGQWQDASKSIQTSFKSMWHYGPHRSLALVLAYGLTLALLCGITLAVTTFFLGRYIHQLMHQWAQQYGFHAGSSMLTLTLLVLLLVPIALRLGAIGSSCFFLLLICPWLSRKQAVLSSILVVALACVPSLTYEIAKQLNQSYGQSSLAWRSLVEKQDPHLLPALSNRQHADLNEQVAWLFHQHQQQPSEASTQALLQLLPQVRNSAEIWFLLGNGYLQLGKLSQAQQAYEKALLADPQHAPTLYHLSQMLLQQEKKAAGDYFQQLQQLDPTQANQWQQLHKTYKLPFIQADGLQVLQLTTVEQRDKMVIALQQQLWQSVAGWLPQWCMYGVIVVTLLLLWANRLSKVRFNYHYCCANCSAYYRFLPSMQQPTCEDCRHYQDPNHREWTAFQRLQYELRLRRTQAFQRSMSTILYYALPGIGHLYRNRLRKGLLLLALFELGCCLTWLSMQQQSLTYSLLPLPSQVAMVGIGLLVVAYGWSWLDQMRWKGLHHGT